MPVHNWKRVDAGIFHDFHLSWIFQIREALNGGLLPPAFYALAEQRAGGKSPDVLTLQRVLDAAEGGTSGNGNSAHLEGKTLAVIDAPPQVAFVDDLDDESYVNKRRTVAIRHVTGDELVALIEIMSPGNKSSQLHLDQFVDKTLMAIQAGIHVLIVDIHPPTPRDPRGIHGVIAQELGRDEIPFDPGRSLTLVAYRANGATRAYVQPVAPGERLVEMPLFLSEEHYINVPLEATYAAAFHSVPPHLRAILESPT